MTLSEREFQKEVKKVWSTTRKRLQVLGDEAVRLAHRGEEEVVRAAKVGRIQFDVLNVKRKQDRIHQEIGRRIVELVRKGKVDIPGIKPQVTRSLALSRQIRSSQTRLVRTRRSSKRRRSTA